MFWCASRKRGEKGGNGVKGRKSKRVEINGMGVEAVRIKEIEER